MAAVSGHDVVAEEDFTERELEVAAILADLPSIVRAQRRRQRRLEQQQQQRPEIPTWGRRRPRKAPAALPAAVAEKPAAVISAAAEDDHRREGAASPDTPLAFPDDHHHEEETGDKKAAAQEEWAQQQRGVVASLSHENAHLLKQIEEFRARLATSRSTNDSLNQMQQSKHKKRYRPPSSEEEEQRRPKLQARIVAAVADRPALDLNEPADADAEDAKPQTVAAQWFHRGHQHLQLMRQKAALTAAARRRRREIRRAKGASSASRTRRMGSNKDDAIIIDSDDNVDKSDNMYYTDEDVSEEEIPRYKFTKFVKLTVGGPLYAGNMPFDQHCYFANEMTLTELQQRFLVEFVKDSPGEPIKNYVYKMTNSSVILNKCKMEFGLHFTNRYLERYLIEPIKVDVDCNTSKKIDVECNTSNEDFKIRMKLGQGTNKAIMTSGWATAVKMYRIEEKDICIFSFWPKRESGLHLLITHLHP